MSNTPPTPKMPTRGSLLSGSARTLAVALAAGFLGSAAFVSAPAAHAEGLTAGSRVYWQERFDRPDIHWVDPARHDATALSRVYSIGHEGAVNFLHAHHDGTGESPPKAMHYGRAFPKDAPPLERIASLTWRWRVTQHPAVRDDAWEDMAAGVYVIMRTPDLITSGKGFKFGWLAKPGAKGTRQRGIRQTELRHDAAGGGWVTENVDICALFEREYGKCDGEHVLYVGVVTDADGTKSVADADYADFALVAK